MPNLTPTPTPTPTPRRRPGRPPSDAARSAVLDVAYRILMADGLGRLTIERVAAEAGVGKPTIYRTWTNAQDLAMAAFMAHVPREAAAPRPREVQRALVAHLAAVLAAFASQRGRQITLTLASADPDSELAKAFRNQVILKSREAGRALLMEGIVAGQVRHDVAVEVVLDMLYGPVFFRLLLGHQPLEAALAEQLVRAAFEGIAVAR